MAAAMSKHAQAAHPYLTFGGCQCVAGLRTSQCVRRVFGNVAGLCHHPQRDTNMATLDPQTFDVVSVEPSESFTGDLIEYRFDNPDPNENWQYVFYDLSDRGLPYSVMAVLEYLYKNKHSVRITVEDLGESESARLSRERTENTA